MMGVRWGGGRAHDLRRTIPVSRSRIDYPKVTMRRVGKECAGGGCGGLSPPAEEESILHVEDVHTVVGRSVSVKSVMVK